MLMHRLAFLAFIIGGFPLHCVQRTMSFFKGRSKMDIEDAVEDSINKFMHAYARMLQRAIGY